jgi:hypothetical protein
MKKAYDRVNIDFLMEILKCRGFGDKWIDWIRKVVIGGSMSVMANEEEMGCTFKTWVEAGGPLSPLPFNLVADVLNRMLAKVSREELVSGLLGEFRLGGILSLQYADDTLLFSTPNYSSLKNLKEMLMLFE